MQKTRGRQLRNREFELEGGAEKEMADIEVTSEAFEDIEPGNIVLNVEAEDRDGGQTSSEVMS